MISSRSRQLQPRNTKTMGAWLWRKGSLGLRSDVLLRKLKRNWSWREYFQADTSCNCLRSYPIWDRNVLYWTPTLVDVHPYKKQKGRWYERDERKSVLTLRSQIIFFWLGNSKQTNLVKILVQIYVLISLSVHTVSFKCLWKVSKRRKTPLLI